MLMMARGRMERMILLNMLIARTLLMMNNSNYINYSYYRKILATCRDIRL